MSNRYIEQKDDVRNLISPFHKIMYLFELGKEFGIEGSDWGDTTYRLPNYKIIVPNNSLGFILKSKDITLTVNNYTTELYNYYVGNDLDLDLLYKKVSKNIIK